MTQNQKFDFNALSTNQKGVLGAALGMLIALLLPFFEFNDEGISVWELVSGDIPGMKEMKDADGFGKLGLAVLIPTLMHFVSHSIYIFIATIGFVTLTYLNEFKNKEFHLYARICAIVVLLNWIVWLWTMNSVGDKSITSVMSVGAYLLLASSAAAIYFSRKD